MAINFKEKLSNATNKLINNLLGTPVKTEPYYGYSKEIEDAKNSLGDLESVQTMLGQPNAKSIEQIQQGFTQGLNYGNPEIAKLQDDLGIAKPDTNNKMQLDMAKSGMFNLPDTLHSGTSNRQGGFINDLVSGYRENLTEGFDTENLAPNENKGLATRIGEGLGTARRFFDKPVGRGLLAGAAALALGGGAGSALAYALGTGVGRQNYITKDKAYRQQLKEMGFDAAEVDAIPGNITDDVFKNIVASEQAKAMTQWRIDQLKALEEDREIKNKIREEESAFDRAYKKEKLAQGWAGIEADKNKPTKTRTIPAGNVENLSATYQGLQQMSDLIQKIPELPTRITTPGVAQISALNPLDTKAQAFNQYVKTYKQVIGKGLEGGVLRKEDEYKYDQIIPKVGDTAKVLQEKAKQLQAMLLNKYNADLEFLEKAGYDTSNLQNIQTPKSQVAKTQPIQVGNYKVRVK